MKTSSYSEVKLFLGFPMNEKFKQAFNTLDPRIADLYIKVEDSSYLQSIEYEGVQYLGKTLNPLAEIASLELLQLNIYSLLNKLVPDFPYETVPLRLVPRMQVLKN